jgi:hypothetical protein
MTDLTISGKLAEQIYEIAQREQRQPDEVLATMVAQYHAGEPAAFDGPADEDIEVPADIQNPAKYRDAVRRLRPKLYRMAREYWQKTGDTARLALTDAELHKQFWLIDHEGIPRLKADKGTVTIPPDPLEALVGLIDDAPPDLSSSIRDTMAARFQPKADDASAT